MPSLIFVSPLSRDFTGKDSSQCFKFNTFPLQMKSEENNGQDQQEKLCSISVNSLSILSNEQIVLLPACFRSETRITNWWSLNLKHAGHSTWNTFNPNLPRRISSPTFDADVVVIRCQSALLCRSIILKHVYFLEAIASLGLTFSLGHSVTHSVTNLQFLQERWLTTYFQVVNYLFSDG